jgi:GSH-dependent disulfide-bond oxidoreductase
VDFQGAHSVLGSASHSGFGNEPAMVVGNSMGASRSVLIERLSAMSYGRGTEQRKSPGSCRSGGVISPGNAMIDLHYAPTPNGWKISIMLEELGVPYKVIPVNIRAGDQFKPEFLAISPNNRIPAIVDHAPSDGGGPFSVFETGAILIYLAEKTGRFLPKDMRGRSKVIQWVMWQMSGLGPMLGQHGHFALYAPEKIPYAIERYRDEAARLYRVLDVQLGKTGAYVAGDYSIADIACFPWTMTHKAQGFTLDDYPNIKRWYAEVRARPQVQAGLAIGKFVKEPFDEEARKNMFGQKAKELAGKK